MTRNAPKSPAARPLRPRSVVASPVTLPRLFLLLLTLTPSQSLKAQVAEPLQVQTNLQEFIDRDHAVVVSFNRPPGSSSERIAIFVDRMDLTDLFRRSNTGTEFRYERGVVLLPSGEHELVVYRLDGLTGNWEELHRQSFQTLGRLGFQPGETDPALTGAWNRRLVDAYDPESAAPPSVSENVDLQFRLSTEHVRENLTLASQTALVGATQRRQALRYNALGEEAPKVDLSSYRVDAVNGPVSFSVGHISGGNQRHLVNNFSSRGSALTLQPGSRLDLTFAAQSGSGEVGWSNLLGIQESDHRVVSGSLGVEALPTPGALRLELTGMQGSILPRSGFNQGAVTDAEESRGVALRVTAQALDRRLRLDAGYAASAFENPNDPLLNQGFDVVEVEEETSGARYLEASVDAIRNLPLGESRSGRLTLGVRHERVDPLYRSLGAYAQSDRANNGVDIRADVAGVSIQGGVSRSRNNLDEIRSILTSHTERSQVSLGVPLARVLSRTSAWLPSLQLRSDRTHQFGESIPVHGGFDPSHIPDQVSLNRTASAEWRVRSVSFGLQWNRSQQDNRQVGREDADLNVTRRGGTLRFTPFQRANVSLDLAQEISENVQRDETDETFRWGGQLSWQLFDRSSLSVRVSDTNTQDVLDTRSRGNRQWNAQWSSVVPMAQRFQGQYFLRLNHTESNALNLNVQQRDRRKAWWLDLGLNFTFF